MDFKKLCKKCTQQQKHYNSETRFADLFSCSWHFLRWNKRHRVFRTNYHVSAIICKTQILHFCRKCSLFSPSGPFKCPLVLLKELYSFCIIPGTLRTLTCWKWFILMHMLHFANCAQYLFLFLLQFLKMSLSQKLWRHLNFLWLETILHNVFAFIDLRDIFHISVTRKTIFSFFCSICTF